LYEGAPLAAFGSYKRVKVRLRRGHSRGANQSTRAGECARLKLKREQPIAVVAAGHP
jgi:hypothetical protein